MGYAGGEKEYPTYRNLGDHTETLEVDFDPEKISYEEMLKIFWESHRPLNPPRSKQYMSIIFYHNQEQEELARAVKARLEEKYNYRLYTEIRPFKRFYLAEDYHQKYYLQNNRGMMKELGGYFDNFQDFVNSTAAARINGYLAGYGSEKDLEGEIDSLGLSPEGQKRLKALTR